MTKLVLKEIDDDLAASVNGGGSKWQDLYLASVGALQINGGNGVQNNYYIFNININLGGGRHKK